MQFSTGVASIDTALRPRMISAENPDGKPGSGGREAAGRKGSPAIWLEPNSSARLAQVNGPGVMRHMGVHDPADAPGADA